MIQIKNQILAITACMIYLFVGITSRIKKINEEILKRKKENHKNVIFAFWHGRQFLLILTHRFRNILTMTSLSLDGSLQTAIVSKLGYRLVRGSAGKRGAVEGTLNMIGKIKEGYDAAFTVDGPTGPGFEIKPGILYVARKTNCPIIPVSCSAKRKKILNNWDKYLVPFPFNHGVIIYGEPITVGQEDDIESKSNQLKNELDRITSLADQLVEA
jgi:lysophospholipid acyltransferase (LPLAT)-like uncharacterized protein